MDEITRKLREARAGSSDPETRAGVWPVSWDEKDPVINAAVTQHDLDCDMHAAGIGDTTLPESNNNFCKNVFFRARQLNSLPVWVKVAGMCAGATALTWLVW